MPSHELLSLYASRLGADFIKKRVALEKNTHETALVLAGIKFDLEQMEAMIQKFAGILKILRVYARGERNSLDYEQIKRKVYFKNLPKAFSGFKILHLTDFHLEGIVDGGEKLKNILRSVEYDICVLTGDYRFDIKGPFAAAVERLGDILKALDPEKPVYGILGNHDSLSMLEELEKIGIRMLINESAPISRAGESIWLTGVDDSFYFKTHDFEKAHKSVPQEAFKILLAHTPELFREAARYSTDFYLCGHTHGGQICFPRNFVLVRNANCPYQFSTSSWKYGRMQGYTSRGVGASAIPIRFLCRPEITVHELCAAI